jgi:hypothetical protein
MTQGGRILLPPWLVVVNERSTMKTLIVRYKTTEAHAEKNAANVRAVYDELRAKKPEGIQYRTYRLPDGVSFIHVATHSGPGDNPIPKLDAFQIFQRELKERCAEPPVTTELSIVDSYG